MHLCHPHEEIVERAGLEGGGIQAVASASMKARRRVEEDPSSHHRCDAARNHPSSRHDVAVAEVRVIGDHHNRELGPVGKGSARRVQHCGHTRNTTEVHHPSCPLCGLEMSLREKLLTSLLRLQPW